MKDMHNWIEALEDGEWNQRCKYGYLIPGHSVYIHDVINYMILLKGLICERCLL
jgi:hypothetical protein